MIPIKFIREDDDKWTWKEEERKGFGIIFVVLSSKIKNGARVFVDSYTEFLFT